MGDWIILNPTVATNAPRSNDCGKMGRGAAFLWESNSVSNRCFQFAVFAAKLARNRNDPEPTLQFSMPKTLQFSMPIDTPTGAFYSPHSRLGWRGTHTTPG